MNAIQSSTVCAGARMCRGRKKGTVIAKPEYFLEELHSSGSQKQSVT